MRSIELARVFYRVEAETKGLDGQLKGAEKSLGRLGDFIRNNPVAAAGALGVALLGVAAKATQMAEAVEIGFRRLGALVPGLTTNLKRVKDGVAAIAQETGRSQEELLANAQAIAAQGVENTEDLLTRLRIVTNLAKVTGTETGTIAAGLDQVLDVFGLAADRATEVGARLFAMAKGKAPLEDLFAAIQGAAPGIRDMGLSFDVAAQALTALLAEGKSPKQAASELKELAKQGTAGRAELVRLAGAAQSGTTAFATLESSLKSVNDTTTEQLRQLQVSWENFAIFMGQKIVPVLTTVLRLLTPESASIDAVIRRQIERGRAATSGALGGPATGGGSAPALTPEQTKAADSLQRRMEDMLTAFSATAVDNTLLALKRFQEEAAKVIAGLPAAEAEAMQRQVDAVVAGFKRQIEEIRTKERADALSARNTPLTPSVVDRRIPLRTDYTKADKAMAAKTEALAKAEEDLAEQRAKNIAQARAEYQAMEQAARGALQIASALGIMNADLAQALTGLVQFGAGLKELKAFNANGASGLEKLSAGLGVVGAAVSALSAIGGLLGIGKGPSPNEIAREKALKQNNEAIRELSRQIGHLGSVLGGISGTTLGGVLTATAAGVAAGGVKGSNDLARLALERELQRLGLSMLDLREVARGLGLAFVGAEPTFNEMQQLLKALRTAELTRFAETFGGQMQELQDVFEVFDITDPLEQLRKLVALFNDPKFGSPALRKALAGLDLSTPEGRAAAEQAIQELVKRLGLDPNKGGITLDDLGGMSPDEFRQALLDLEKRLDELGQAGDPQGEMNQFAVQRTITEVQANLLASLLTTDAYWNEQTARNTAAIVAALGASLPTGSIAPPAFQGAGAGGDAYFTINVTLPGMVDLPTATAIGGGIADGLLAQMNAKLGSDYRARKLLSGNVTQV